MTRLSPAIRFRKWSGTPEDHPPKSGFHRPEATICTLSIEARHPLWYIAAIEQEVLP